MCRILSFALMFTRSNFNASLCRPLSFLLLLFAFLASPACINLPRNLVPKVLL